MLDFFFKFLIFYYDQCLKEKVGMAELGMAEVGRGSLKSDVARFWRGHRRR